MTVLSAVLADTADSSQGGGGFSPTMILLLALVFGAFWFMSRRNRKQQQKQADFRNNLQPGDEVMTGSGMLGTVVEVEDDVITIESTAGGGRTRWVRRAILNKIEPPVVEDDAEVEDDERDPALDEADRIARANDAVIDVPDDLSSLPPARKDDDDKK